MKDRIEIAIGFDNKGQKVLNFYVHSDLGRLYLHTWDFSLGVYKYFRNGKSASELFKHRYDRNKALNKIVDRLPAYIKDAKRCAVEEQAYFAARDAAQPQDRDADERAA